VSDAGARLWTISILGAVFNAAVATLELLQTLLDGLVLRLGVEAILIGAALRSHAKAIGFCALVVGVVAATRERQNRNKQRGA